MCFSWARHTTIRSTASAVRGMKQSYRCLLMKSMTVCMVISLWYRINLPILRRVLTWISPVIPSR